MLKRAKVNSFCDLIDSCIGLYMSTFPYLKNNLKCSVIEVAFRMHVGVGRGGREHGPTRH